MPVQDDPFQITLGAMVGLQNIQQLCLEKVLDDETKQLCAAVARIYLV
jgi:hypothetical protein